MNKAITAEDVFYLYERNKCVYDNCKLAGRRCPDAELEMECYCSISNTSVLPITIGDQSVKCDFKRKVYIKQGEECSICLEQIYQKNNAYLTSCGHSFHKSCLFKEFETKFVNINTFKCPNCRSKLGYPEFYCRYTNVFKRFDSELCKHYNFDILEDFWLGNDFTTLQMCNRGHALGMKNGCNRCLAYRLDGV
jgi:hypothetical protein